jgi:hypothetical protein
LLKQIPGRDHVEIVAVSSCMGRNTELPNPQKVCGSLSAVKAS